MRVRARDVHEHERIVDEAEREQADARNVEHELFFHFEGHVFLRLGLKVLGIREFPLRHEQQHERDRARNGQHGEARGIDLKRCAVRFEEHHQIQQHRAEKRPDLVEHLLDAEALADALLRGGKGQDGVLRGLFDGLAHTLDDEQRARPDPAVLADERERRHGQHVEHVADDRHRPVVLGLVRELAEHVAHRVAHELPEAGDEADRPGRGAQQRQIRAADARRPLVRHVGKQAHDSEQHHERHGLRVFPLLLILHRLSPLSLRPPRWESPPCSADRARRARARTLCAPAP